MVGNYYSINGIDYECIEANKKELIFESTVSGNCKKISRSNFNRMIREGDIEELY